MEKQGGSFFGGPNFDRQIFVPISSYLKAFGGGRGRQEVDIAVKAPQQGALTDLEFQVIGEMRKIPQLRPADLTAVINATLMPASVSIPILVVAVTVSIAVGVLAGIVPAYRGARLDPIESLRYE